MKIKRIIASSALWLGILQLVLILASWLVTAAMPELSMRSLLSSEGIRWFFGHFTDNIGSPWLVMLIVCFIAYGAIKTSGLCSLHHPMEFREKFALRLIAFEAIVFVIVIALLTLVPHAILLSVTGNIWPSSFGNSIVPYCAFAASTMSISFALASGKKHTLTDIFDMLTAGINIAAPWILIYILVAQLISSLIFVIG